MSASVPSRRRFLGTMAGAGVALSAGATGCGELLSRENTGELLESRLPLPKPFTVPLPLPSVAEPVRPGVYELTQRVAELEIIPGTRTEVWGYDGAFPGPTLELLRGAPVTVRVANELPAPTATHLHGGITPPESDGYPTHLVVPKGKDFVPVHGDHMHVPDEQWIFYQGAQDYEFPVEQPAATLWYHDHRMDFTGPQVWRGLAGFALVRDEEEDGLPLPRGERELPLFICDRSFEEDGSFAYPSLDPSLLGEPGVEDSYMAGVHGDVILVNGAPWPVHEVTATRYRLRLLNGSNARRYRLRLDPGAPMIQVGSDVGLLKSPVEHEEITMAPAERFDVVVDFSAYTPGTEVTLMNTLGTGRTREVMRFVVTGKASDDSAVPETLARLETPGRGTAVTTRTFDFRMTEHMWKVNGKVFHPGTPLCRPRLGTTELWRLTTDFHHPVHTHLGHFLVLTRNGKEPRATDRGWKDTVDVEPYEVVEVLVRFEGYRGQYVMHCHNLEHEDMAMMADIEVV